MRNLAVTFFWVLTQTIHSQSIFSMESFAREESLIDTNRFFVEVSGAIKLTGEKPITLMVPKSGILVPDEKDKRLRFQFQGRKTFTLFWKRDLSKNFQPHNFVEITGFSTYLSMRGGMGFTDRFLRTSFGLVVGKYMKRTNGPADVTYKAKAFEEAPSLGFYFHSDQSFLSMFILYSHEKSGHYRRIEMAGKLSCFWGDGLLSNTRVRFESETFFGNGVGLSYHPKSGRYNFSVSYMVPETDEKHTQRPFGNYLGEGVRTCIQVLWF